MGTWGLSFAASSSFFDCRSPNRATRLGRSVCCGWRPAPAASNKLLRARPAPAAPRCCQFSTEEGDVQGFGKDTSRIASDSLGTQVGPVGTAGAAGAIANANQTDSALWNQFVRASTVATNLFPLWTVISALLAIVRPSAFLWVSTSYFTLGLAILMLSMGITLTMRDFARVLRRPGAIAVGFFGCYGLMPLLALALGRLLRLSPELIAGLVLVGSINGGQASNLCTYIANGNVALSVMMTTCTTMGAIFMTPFLCKFLIGAVVSVDAIGIALSTMQVVLAPIAVGMLLNRYANRLVQRVLPFSPLIGVVSTCLLVGSAVAQVAEPILAAGVSLQVPVFLLHLLGGVFGYFIPRFLGYNEVVCRTTAIETAMKSSAFGFLLAKLHFAEFAVRIPSAVSVVWMALMGSSMAVFWRFIPVKQTHRFDRSLIQRKRSE
ncbi:hypothetical protein CCYA_CCYA07G2155 [Cyanidiococcus yangmingshanensis]|nr:hypothetical protein CCYA_CCYA07G2155 [Cyanidiococcus yangmingshanensis]